MTWGRAAMGGGGGSGPEGKMVNGDAGIVRRVNVLATGSVDQTIKVGPGPASVPSKAVSLMSEQIWTP